MTIDPNMIEVNEITDYWSFLMSVCLIILNLNEKKKKHLKYLHYIYRLIGGIHGS